MGVVTRNQQRFSCVRNSPKTTITSVNSVGPTPNPHTFYALGVIAFISKGTWILLATGFLLRNGASSLGRPFVLHRLSRTEGPSTSTIHTPHTHLESQTPKS